ncbi:MAG TPA: choice-of-anchor P family protein, partial [Acidimicrobiales bacterium]|nr:choice-of-anchor P family protein [Acidimicrobiales bacterium]
AAAGLDASTDGVPAAGGPARVSSAAAVDGLSVGGGLLAAAHLSSLCRSTEAGVTGSASVTALTLARAPVAVPTAPNTSVEVPGVLRAVLNEQVVDGTAITVRAAHVQVLPTGPGTQLLDLVVAESRCALTPGSPLVPSTSTPPPTRVARTTTTRAGPTTSTVPPPVSTTLPPPTTMAPATTTSVGPPPVQAVDVRAASGGARSGPAGTELGVSATGFGGCDDVEIRFDSRRIGVGHPDGAGRLSEADLSVPGDASGGAHEVSASCRSSGRLLRAAAAFDVVDLGGVHRSAFVTSLAEPDQIGTSARSILLSAAGALAMLLAVAFPSQLFNSTLDENYDEVRGWFGFHRPHDDESIRHQVVEFVAFVLLGGLLYGLLSPGFGFDRSSVALVVGLSLSLVVVSLGFRLPHLLYVHHQDGEWGKLRVLPGTAAVAVVCVALSRLVHFQPGYLYGLIAGLALRRQLATETNGALTAASAVSIFSVGILAWIARVPVAHAAAGPHPSLWAVGLEACLAAITILGIETVVICLIPLRFVEGSKLEAWSRTAWALVFGLAAFGYVHVLLRPDSGYVAPTSARLTVVVLFLVFGLLSVAFWAYFRFRAPRPSSPATAELRA